jgi:hypothetical protein
VKKAKQDVELEYTRQIARERSLPFAQKIISSLHDDYVQTVGVELIKFLGDLRCGRQPDLSGSLPGTLLYELNPELRILSVAQNTITLNLPAGVQLPELPDHYSFKGGVARYALLSALFPAKGIRQPRDIDLVRFARADRRIDLYLKSNLLGEDGIRGHGVEYPGTPARYFATRDLRINQVYANSKKIVCSFNCLEDTLGATLRLAGERGVKAGRERGRSSLKLIRFAAELRLQGFECRFVLPEDLRNEEILPFDLRLECSRALERGRRIAEEFFRALKDEGIVSEELQHFGDLLASLEGQIVHHKAGKSSVKLFI